MKSPAKPWTRHWSPTDLLLALLDLEIITPRGRLWWKVPNFPGRVHIALEVVTPPMGDPMGLARNDHQAEDPIGGSAHNKKPLKVRGFLEFSELGFRYCYSPDYPPLPTS